MQDDRLLTSIAHALVCAFREVNRAHNRALAPLGVSAEQAHILVALWFHGPMKVGELQRMLMVGSGTLTGAVDRMEDAGLVRRVQDSRDKRAWRIEPGRVEARKRRSIEDTLEATEEGCFGALTRAERNELGRLLRKVSASLRAEEPVSR